MALRSKKKPARPSVFVGSSVESLPVAYAIQENLQHDAEVTVWPQGVFQPSRTALQSLAGALDRSDYGVFVFSPDDRTMLRKRTFKAVRDNVILELGLFVGKLGLDRTFFVVPSDDGDLRIPTDLTGVTPGNYDARRRDKNLRAALGPFCNEVRTAVKKGGLARRSTAKKLGPASSLRNVKIHSAMYGSENKRIDVRTPLLKALRSKGVARVGNELAGDPEDGVVKNLKLDFTFRKQRQQLTVPEGVSVAFPQ